MPFLLKGCAEYKTSLKTSGWCLWFSSGSIWTRHSFIPSRSHTLTFHRNGEQVEPTSSLQCAMVQVHDTKVIFMGISAIIQYTRQMDCILNLQQYAFSCNWQWEIIVIGSLLELMENIKAGNGYSMSDGLFQTGWGAAPAWIIEGHNNANWLIETCFSLSNAEGHSLFHSKLVRIYVMLFILQMLLPSTTEKLPFRLACDSKWVLMVKTDTTDWPNGTTYRFALCS